MAKKRKSEKSSVQQFEIELQALNQKTEPDLQLPSLSQDPPRLQGYSFKFTLVLPLMSSTGAEVFTEEHLSHLLVLLCGRFGGLSISSSTSHPSHYGYYQPPKAEVPLKDYYTKLEIYAAPIDAANLFFARLKAILRTAPLQPQEEILVERLDAMLI